MIVAPLVLALITTAASEESGYKGIRWGSDCAAARQKLADDGVTFNRPDGSAAWPTTFTGPLVIAKLNSMGLKSVIEQFTIWSGHAEGLSFEVVCRGTAFVAIKILAGDVKGCGLLKKRGGKASATISYQPNPLRDSLHQVSRLASAGDSVRYLEASPPAVNQFGEPIAWCEYSLYQRETHDSFLVEAQEKLDKLSRIAADREAAQNQKREALLP